MSDLRRHPRIPADLNVDVTNGLGATARAQIRNLSPGGVMIDGDQAFKELVCQGRDQDPLSHPIEVEIRCRFPGEFEAFISHCRLIYWRRLSQDRYNLGFRFVKLQPKEAERLERYVMRDYQPREAVRCSA